MTANRLVEGAHRIIVVMHTALLCTDSNKSFCNALHEQCFQSLCQMASRHCTGCQGAVSHLSGWASIGVLASWRPALLGRHHSWRQLWTPHFTFDGAPLQEAPSSGRPCRSSARSDGIAMSCSSVGCLRSSRFMHALAKALWPLFYPPSMAACTQ